MKHSRKILAASVAAVVVTAHPSAAQGPAIGLHFVGDDGSFLNGGEIAGVFPQFSFNNAEGQVGNLTGLTDSNGNVTTIGVNWTGQGTWDAATHEDHTDRLFSPLGHSDDKLMSGYLDLYQNNAPAVQFTGLIPGSQYDVYVYSLTAVNGRGGTFDVNGSITQLVANATSTTFTNNVNYLLFPGVAADGSGDINVNNDSSLTSPGLYREAVNGVQLVAVPEPVSLSVGLAAAAFGLGFRRRHRE